MPASLCRVSIHSEGAEGPFSTDLALPATMPVAVLIPPIVDLVDDGRSTGPARWRLSRIGGTPLDESMTLAENEVHDGELLILSTAESRRAGADGRCPAEVVAASVPAGWRPPDVRGAVSLWAALVSAVALMVTAATPAPGHLVAAATIGAVAAAFAIARHRDRPCGIPVAIAVVFAAATGFLAVPAGPSAANWLLAAAAAVAAGTLLLRITGCGTTYLTAVVAAASISLVALAPAAVMSLSVQAVGAALSAVALAVLGAAARISVAVAGLSPAMPTADDPGHHDPGHHDPGHHDDRDDDAAGRAIRGHTVLTGVVAGAAVAAALAALLITLGCLSRPTWPGAAALTAVVGAALLLRARTYAGGQRAISLVVSGICSLTAAFALVAAAAPAHAHWIAAFVAGSGMAVHWSAAGATPGPIARRAVDLLEYLALAAVLPLACWVAGLYSLAGGWALP